MDDSGKRFCLSMPGFETNLREMIGDLQHESDFFDVTFGCTNSLGRTLQAHKVLLSASSGFFKDLLQQQDHPKPYIYLNGIKYDTLQSLLDFIYQGEVSIAEEDLETFLAVTSEFKIKGLVNKDGTKISSGFEQPSVLDTIEDYSEDNVKFIAPTLKKPTKHTLPKERMTDSDQLVKRELKLRKEQLDEVLNSYGDETQDESEDTLKPEKKPKRKTKSATVVNYCKEDDIVMEKKPRGKTPKLLKKNKARNSLSDSLLSLVERLNDGSGRCRCLECDKLFSSYVGVRQHLDIKHNEDAESFECNTCQKTIKSKQKFRIHLYGHNMKGDGITGDIKPTIEDNKVLQCGEATSLQDEK